MKTRFEFHISIRDPHHLAKTDRNVETYPLGVLVQSPNPRFAFTDGARPLLVLNPLKARDNSAVIVLPTRLSRNVALILGFRTSQSGLPDVRQPFASLLSVDKDVTFKDGWSDGLELLSLSKSTPASKVTIDEVQISAETTQRCCWQTSRSILIHFSPVLDGQTGDSNSKNLPKIGAPADDVHSDFDYAPSIVNILWPNEQEPTFEFQLHGDHHDFLSPSHATGMIVVKMPGALLSSDEAIGAVSNYLSGDEEVEILD